MDRADVAAALAAPTYSIRVVPGVKDKLVASEHHDTLVELCRQQHEALGLLMNDEWRMDCGWGPKADRDEIWSQCEKVLALWPDGGE